MEVHAAFHFNVMGNASDGQKAEGVGHAEGPRALLISHVDVIGKGGVKRTFESVHPYVAGVLLQLNVGHLFGARARLFPKLRGKAYLVE